LLFAGLLALQGETRIWFQYHDAIVENFGFAYKLQGRGWVYLIIGLYGIGYRYEENVIAGAVWGSAFMGMLWVGLSLQYTRV